jgi:hypothetical protein
MGAVWNARGVLGNNIVGYGCCIKKPDEKRLM